MIILHYHEVFFRLAVSGAMSAHFGAYSLQKTSRYCIIIIILLGVEDHPNKIFLIFFKILGLINMLKKMFSLASTDIKLFPE